MKIELPFNRVYIALFSNIGSKNKNHFYLLMTYHNKRNGGFDEEITPGECQKLLEKVNPEYTYKSKPGVL